MNSFWMGWFVIAMSVSLLVATHGIADHERIAFGRYGWVWWIFTSPFVAVPMYFGLFLVMRSS
jgi:succinate-acetate transporter protein